MTKVALVTGAGGGIGRATAEALVEQGFFVEAADVNTSSLQELSERHGDRLRTVELDVTSASDVEATASAIRERHQRLDALVNAAGVQFAGPSAEMSLDAWRRVLEINLTGTFLCAQAMYRLLRGAHGSVVNLGSVAGHVGMPERAPYGASKAGVLALTRVLAAEWGRDGVRVNAVSPGYTRTPMVQDAIDHGRIALQPILDRSALPRLAEPAEIAAAITWLVGPSAAFVTGTELVVDGGWLATGLLPGAGSLQH